MSDAVIQRLEEAVIRAFPTISAVRARFAAKAFAAAVDEAHQLFHHGKEDRAALAAIIKALDRLSASVDSASPWMKQALSTVLHDRLLSRGIGLQEWRDRVPDLPPMTCEDLLAAAQAWREAAAAAPAVMDFGRPEGSMKWRAVALIAEAVGFWDVNGGRNVGRDCAVELTEGHPFEAFLKDLFDACGIDASPRGQFRAWRGMEKQSSWEDFRP